MSAMCCMGLFMKRTDDQPALGREPEPSNVQTRAHPARMSFINQHARDLAPHRSFRVACMPPTKVQPRLFSLRARHAASAHREHAGELGRAERHMRRARGQRVHAVAQRAQAAVDGLHAPGLSLLGVPAVRARRLVRARTRLQPPGTPRAARGRPARRAREGCARRAEARSGRHCSARAARAAW